MIFDIVCACWNLKPQSLLYGVIELMKLFFFLKAFKQMFLKERIDRTAIIIFVKINHSGKTFSHYGPGADTSYSKIRNMYKNALASEYILLLICSFTPVLQLGIFAPDYQRKVGVTLHVIFSKLLPQQQQTTEKQGKKQRKIKKIKWSNSWCGFLGRPNSIRDISVSSQCVWQKQSVAFMGGWKAISKAACCVW